MENIFSISFLCFYIFSNVELVRCTQSVHCILLQVSWVNHRELSLTLSIGGQSAEYILHLNGHCCVLEAIFQMFIYIYGNCWSLNTTSTIPLSPTYSGKQNKTFNPERKIVQSKIWRNSSSAGFLNNVVQTNIISRAFLQLQSWWKSLVHSNNKHVQYQRMAIVAVLYVDSVL